MKELREGVSTGSCMTGGAEASVIWQTTGKCPSVVKVETPIGKTLYLDIIPKEFGVCGVVKDAGDDPDVTNGSEIITKVELFEEEGDISFFGGDGVGTITQEGLKIPPGQPAINPVPRQMAEKAIRRIIGNKKANITVRIITSANVTRNAKTGKPIMFTALNSEKMLSVPIIDTGLKTPGKCSEPITRINPAAMLAVIDKISFLKNEDIAVVRKVNIIRMASLSRYVTANAPNRFKSSGQSAYSCKV